MDKVYILNIFLILILVLIISLFLVYYFKITRLATNLTTNLEYGCTTELDIPEPKYENITDEKLFYKQFICYGINLVYYYTEKNKKIIVNDETTELKQILYDKDKNMFGIFVYHKKANVNFIIYRGSLTSSDWSDIDFDIEQKDYPNHQNACVHSGFYNRFNELKDQLVKIFGSYNDKTISLYIGGHSLGCPICIFTALLISQKYSNIHTNTYVFALPKMGNQNFAQYVNDTLHNKLEIYENQADIIPQLPFTSTLNIDNKKRPYIYYNFRKEYYYYFYCVQKYICSNHGVLVYHDNISKAKQLLNIEYCSNQVCKY